MTKKILIILVTCCSFFSCNKDVQKISSGTYNESGSAIIINEGNYGSSTASASYIDRNGKVTNYIYETANNGLNIGDVAQSYTRVGNKGIICVNNSNKIEIVDARTFKHLASIVDNTPTANTSYTRYGVAISDDKAYITNGNFDGEVEVIDMNSYTITKSINVGKGPEQLIKFNNNVYVCNSGGFDVDSTISVINTTTDIVTATINIGDIPTKIVKDAQNNLWIICKGKTNFINNLSPAKLVRLNTTTNIIDRNFTLINTGSPSIYNMNLAIGNSGRTLFFNLADNVFSIDITATTLSLIPILTKSKLYGLAASPFNNQIWVLQTPNFTSSGFVFRYTPTGNLIDSLKVGIAPNGAYFNE